jgi:TrmH family RNA methyltransferase
MRLEHLGVAMVEPRFGLNIGYVARTMKNFGAGRLFIVGRSDVPRSAFRFASHGVDVVRSAEYVSLRALREQFDLLVGTTAITGKSGRNPVRKTVTLDRMASLGVDPARVAIVLGRDTTGLTADELSACDMVLHVPTGTSYPTLNVSHALAIILYRLGSEEPKGLRRVGRVYMDELLENFSQMLSLGRYPEHKRRLAVKIFSQAVVKSNAERDEISTLIGVFRKVNLALERRF